MTIARYALVVGVLSTLLCVDQAVAQPASAEPSKYADPTRFEKSIEGFEAQDAKQLPPRGAVLCTGSSTMKMWHGKIADDLAPLTVIPRGFGGSTMHDLLHYTDRIVIPYRPRAIMIYEGDNDIKQGVGAAEVFATFQAFVKKVHAALPKTRIYFMSIKPSYSRRSLWPTMQQANRLIAQECSKNKQLIFIDIGDVLLDKNKQVRRELFKEDDLHLNRAGYEKVRAVVRPVLIKNEGAYEEKGTPSR